MNEIQLKKVYGEGVRKFEKGSDLVVILTYQRDGL